MATLHKVSWTKAQYDAYIAGGGTVPSNYEIFISDAPAGTPNLYTGTGTNTPVAGIVGGGASAASTRKVQITAPNTALSEDASGKYSYFHIEGGGSIATVTVTHIPIPASGVKKFTIQNHSGAEKTIAFTVGVGQFQGVVDFQGNQADNNVILTDNMTVDIFVDEDGFVQATPSYNAATQAELDAVSGTVVAHGTNVSNPHSVTKSQVGLANVDNTTDTAKPVSTAQQTALNLKQDASTAATDAELSAHTGNVANPHTVTKAQVGLGSADNTADTAKPVSTAQQTALDAKAPLTSPTFTGTVSGITKTMVGLGSADNTADTAKPVSTATQTALDGKSATTHNHTGTYEPADATILKEAEIVNTLVGTDTNKPLSAAQGKALKDTADTLATTVGGKQATLVSGTTVKTVNGANVLGSGDIVITPTTVSSTTPTHNLDLVGDNYAGRALHLRPNGMTATANLATWSDISGNGRDVTQATAGNQPDVVENVLNGLPVVRFDGVDDFLANTSYPAPTAISIFAVFKSTVSNRGILTVNSAANVGVVYLTNGEGTGDKFGVYLAGAVPSDWLSHPTSITNLWTIAGATVSATALNVYINGVVTTRALTTAANLADIARIDIGRRIDGGVYNTGDIAEIVVFPTALSDTERQKVEGYLAHKYGLLASLNAGHPYKTTAPQAGDLPTHADNTAATTANLPIGSVYMSADGLLRVRF